MELKKANYDEIHATLQTGDLILFHGQLLPSELTEFLQQSKWSHVAMVVRPKDVGIDYPSLLLWESNTLVNLEDVCLHRSKTGPMLVDLKSRIKTDKAKGYDNLFQVRDLNAGEFGRDRNAVHFKLKEFILKAHSDDYPKTEMRMVKDFLSGRFRGMDPEPSKYFCSELIAATYMHMGLLTKDYVPNSYEPKDFSDRKDLPLLGRAALYNGPYLEVR